PRYPLRTTRQLTVQTLSSSLSSLRPVHGMRVVRSFGYAVRGSTATQPAGSPSTYATSPLVVSASGTSQAVCVRSATVRSGSVESRQIQPMTLYRWHWHCPGSLVAKMAVMSSQEAWLAGTMLSCSSEMGARMGRTVRYIPDVPVPDSGVSNEARCEP